MEWLRRMAPAWSGPSAMLAAKREKSTTSATALSIDKEAASLTGNHPAFEFLNDMRGQSAVCGNVIDRNGNFVVRGGWNQRSDGDDLLQGWLSESASERSEKFLPSWEEEFLQVTHYYRMVALNKLLPLSSALAFIQVVYAMWAGPGEIVEHCYSPTSPAGGVLEHAHFSSNMPIFCCIAIVCCSSLMFRHLLPQWKEHFQALLLHRVQKFSFWWTLGLIMTQFMTGYNRELTRAHRGIKQTVMVGKCANTSHVSVRAHTTAYLIPTRVCIDFDPRQTVTAWPFLHSVGCENQVHDASCVRTLELLSFFVFLHCDWTTALMGSVICGASVVLLSMSVGSFGWHLVRFMLLLCCVSAVNTWLCYIGTSEERIQFAKVKHIKLAAKQSRMSLSTLIPPNVLSRLAYRKNDAGILATEIAHCTIMFCSLVDSGSRKRQFRADNLSPDAAEFQRLHAVYLAFDEVVKMSVIYKYQHVGPWYILACPNAAEPFRELNDPSEGEREGDEGRERVLPRRGSGGGGSAATQWARDSETRRRWGGSWRSSVERVSYGTEMAQLALSLRTIAHHHGFDLKVGVHTGSAAGAVIGKLRAFYCIYGATVNTASRLCGHARPGEIIGSDGFVECLKAEHDKMAAGADGKAAPSWPVITFECRGRQLLKGFSTSIATFAIDGDVATRRVAEGKAFALSKEEFNVDAFPAQRLTLGRRGSEEQDPMISLLKYSDLSQESHLLLQDERLRISGRRILGEHIAISFGFADARIDEQYNEDYWPAMRHRIAGTFVLHFTGILVQYLHVAFPEFFDALASEHSDSGGGAAVTVGNVFEGKYPDLTAMHAHVSTLLLVHLLWTGNACVGLLAALYKGPVRWTEKIGLLALILRIIWALVSVWASHVWPVRSYTVIFTPLYASCQFMIQCASFRVSARLFVVMQLIVLVAFWLSAELLQPLFVSRYIASCIIVCLSNVWAEDSRLRRWRLHRVFRSEMKRFDDILSDLMPMKADIMPFPLAASSDTAPSTTSALAAGDEEPAGVRAGSGDQPRPAKPLSLQLSLRRPSGTYDWNRSCSFHELEAVVLQLDICGFTQFSREVTAMELALTLHHVFSVFDSYVQRLHLFKMDTVGDAYIVAAWLVQDENARETESRWRQQLCHKVLWCAANMLHTIRTHQIMANHGIAARVGISAGKVVVGALGSLQQRVHLRGDAMRSAEQLEQDGVPNMVHCSETFLNLLCAAGREGAAGESEREDGDVVSAAQRAKVAEKMCYLSQTETAGRGSGARERERAQADLLHLQRDAVAPAVASMYSIRSQQAGACAESAEAAARKYCVAGWRVKVSEGRGAPAAEPRFLLERVDGDGEEADEEEGRLLQADKGDLKVRVRHGYDIVSEAD